MADDPPIPEQMYNAIRAGNMDRFKQLLEAHPEEMYYDDGRCKWLSDAASAGQLKILQMLVGDGRQRQ